MQPTQLLHSIIKKKIPSMHTSRLTSLLDAVTSLLGNKVLTLTKLGRNMKSTVKTRSNIRKVDRLLANKHLHKERNEIYKLICSHLIQENSTPIIHIDWSCISHKNNLYLLRASLAVKGRSIVIYEETHRKKSDNNHLTHKDFLNKLNLIIRSSATPIIVTDAGFRAIWFAEIRELGWNFVGRLRNKNSVLLGNNTDWILSKELYTKASGKAKFLNTGLLTKKTQLPCRFVIFKDKNKKRGKKIVANSKGSSTKQKYSKSYKEPWLLVTSLKCTDNLAAKTVAIYRSRMQIEENFRDTKSKRYGFGLNESETRTPSRMGVLLLIAAIATFACWLAGITALARGKAADYQAHSAKFTSVLSIVYLGCEVLKRKFYINNKEYKRAIEQIICWSNTIAGVVI